jgi:hypothetical protein
VQLILLHFLLVDLHFILHGREDLASINLHVEKLFIYLRVVTFSQVPQFVIEAKVLKSGQELRPFLV